jgi:hypothetical protein
MKDTLTSRKFWAAMFLLLVIVVSSFVPSFHMDADLAAGFAIIIVAYILGVAVDPGPGGWAGVIQSRKFWGASVGLLILILDGFGLVLPYGLTAEQLIMIAVTAGTYITGVAWEKGKTTRTLPVSTETPDSNPV